ncbi:hypothetical protein BDA96_03G107200 [Sorghum bicolor]|uniref:Uncharacterized protein n=2 Tax=Sorghum bicolor TaxID=4558 RepID=A0A921UMW4_SORBI|nr:uncharacterized protein LOC8072148 isoform X3 [Sorghum bicolor]EES02635.1 hypothetical protein SORBI_3003G102400 [Sorghum bicolor]KAG0536965.1 hypothetical protein BDA96_03G107200 [Sorghum bicolor]|eukprot:XP_002457515.1 uncharacterized protein LOC8072148 isoform X3 [Sorghum bicolor]
MDRLADGLAAASLSDTADQSAAAAAAGVPSADYLRSVMRAVEGAEATMRSQMEENNRLKEELMRKTQQLQRMREDATSQSPLSGLDQERNSVSNKMDGSNSSVNPQSSLIHRQNGSFESREPLTQESLKQKYIDSPQANGAFKRSLGEQTAVDSGGPSQFSTPSSRSLSPNRHKKDGEYDSRLLPVSEMNSNISWKQDLTVKVKEGEEEIAQLRKHLADYSVKEAQILDDKYKLEKRIAYMRMAFDQQQQDLIDAASKALSYRQDIIEENIRLTYALQAAQQERSIFISSLLPLLSEYDDLQPSVLDAQSIVSNLKVLFKHLQERLIVTEDRLRESRYQITPWHTELSHNTSNPVSTDPPAGKALSKHSLDIVPQTVYPHIQSPMSSPVQARGDWGAFSNKNRQDISNEVPTRSAGHDDMGGTSLSSRNQYRTDVPTQVSQGPSHAVHFDFETQSQDPPFKGLSRNDVLDGSESAETQNTQEPSTQWGPGDSSNLVSGLEDANPSYPYLPTVLEEPGSSFSEAAEDDPLPGIEGLRITGEPFPGRELQASGYPTNGTTTCNFEWVRHLEDGSVNFIEGAKQPSYVVTADDVDTLLAIEVQPLDDRKRKGDFIKVYANDQRKISCDPETKELIKRTLEIGHVTYEVQVQLPQVRFLDIWEPAVLAIKREGYSIKCNGQRGVVITEKFQQGTAIHIPYGHPTEFLITSAASADGVSYNLKPVENTLLRDTIVLVLRLFKNMALERRRGRKKGLFFK